MDKSIEQLQAEIKALTARAEGFEGKEKDLAAAQKALTDKLAEVEKEKESLINRTHPVYRTLSENSDEQKMLKYFGVSHPKDLLAVNTAHPRFAGIPGQFKSMALQLKEDVDTARWIAQMFYNDDKDNFGATKDVIALCKHIGESRFAKEVLLPRLKSFGSSVAGDGGNWIQSIVADSYIEEFELDRMLEGKFTSLPMPSSPWDLPVQGGLTRARIQAENATQTDASFTTAKLTFTAVKLGEFSILPEELNEDSAPSFMPLARKNVIDAQSRAVEEALISGDTTGTHFDSDVTVASDARKAWKGLRRLGYDNSANGGTYDFANTALTDAKMAAMRVKGGKFMINPKTAVWVSGVKVYNQALGLTNVSTVDKFGSAATILQGALAAYAGIPWYISGHFREDLNATGVYDGVTTTRAGAVLVNRERFYRGIRRPIRVRVVPDLPSNDRWLLQSTSRSDFKGVAQSATEVSVVYGYNIAV